MDKTMIHDSLQKFLTYISVVIAVSYFFAQAVPVYADHCAPGDIHLDDGTCLYGSDVVPCQVGEDGCPFGKPVTDLRANIRIALNVILGFLGIIVIGMIVYGAFEWLTSMGSDEKVKKGRDTMLWAAAGAVAIAIAWTLTSFILHTGRVVGG